METESYYAELKDIIGMTLNLGISEEAFNSIIEDAFKEIPEIKKRMPFDVVDEKGYIKEELLKVINNIILSIKTDMPFGVDEIDYINTSRVSFAQPEVSMQMDPIKDFMPIIPFGVDEDAYLKKFEGFSASNFSEFGVEEEKITK